LQKSLLNVPYDQKKEGLNILSNRFYNRVMRVELLLDNKDLHSNFTPKLKWPFLK
jgi:hypothetical protein